ncbi:MAG: hypothetical protein ACSHX0_06650 [Akkermansiaceae bacterium]
MLSKSSKKAVTKKAAAKSSKPTKSFEESLWETATKLRGYCNHEGETLYIDLMKAARFRIRRLLQPEETHFRLAA